MTGDSLAFTQAKEIPMSDPTDVQKSIERMMSCMDLRGLRPNTVSTFAGCARRFLAQVGKAPSVVTAADVETFLLDLCRKGSTPSTRNGRPCAPRDPSCFQADRGRRTLDFLAPPSITSSPRSRAKPASRSVSISTCCATRWVESRLQHILPNRFVKIRHFGLMSSGNVHRSLEQARALLPAADTGAADEPTDGDHAGDDLASASQIDPDLPWPALLLALTGHDVLLCPRCQQRTMVRQLLPPVRAPPQARGAS
jgi:hypothetical protein